MAGIPAGERAEAARRRRAHGGRVRRLGWAKRLYRARWPLLFISPFFVLFAVFLVYPLAYSLVLSFHDWPGLGEMKFVGLQNYRFLFRDAIFWNSMRNAVILFFIYVPVMTFLAVVLASILNAGYLRLQGLWRSLIFLPHITSMVAAGYTFRLLFDTHSGFVNRVVSVVGLSPVPWLDDLWWARITLGVLLVWAWLGYNTVIMLAGLQTIPEEVIDAAKVDGAGPVQILRRITVPLLRPQIAFAVTLSIIGTFALFTEPFVLTRGGPIRATETPTMQIFFNTFESIRMGYAAAMSYVYFTVIVVVTVLQFRFFSRRESWR
jgi:lactose/L-arabinose transport system permease protein